MAITVNHLTAGGSTTNTNSYATASITPGANRLVLAVVSTKSPDAPTVTLTGNGLTWVEVASISTGGTVAQVQVFRAMGASPSAGAITISDSVSVNGCAWHIVEFDGVDTGGTNGSAAVVQSKTGNGNAGSGSVTLDNAFGSADNATYGGVHHAANEGITAGSGFSVVGATFGGHTNPANSAAAEWQAGNDSTIDASWSTSSQWAIIGAEIKAAAAAVDPREGQVSWAEAEAPTAPRVGQLSWGELEAPTAPRTGQLSWGEVEVPELVLDPREGHVSWSEFEAPLAPREGHASWGELEAPDAPREGHVGWVETEAPDAPRAAQLSWTELEVPDTPTLDRSGQASWAEVEAPEAPRDGHVSWAELQAPEVGETPPPGEAGAQWVGRSAVLLPPRAGFVSWAELEVGPPGRQREEDLLLELGVL